MPAHTPTRGRWEDPEGLSPKPGEGRSLHPAQCQGPPRPGNVQPAAPPTLHRPPQIARGTPSGKLLPTVMDRKVARSKQNDTHVCWAPRPPQPKKTRRRGHPVFTTTCRTACPPPGQSGLLDQDTTERHNVSQRGLRSKTVTIPLQACTTYRPRVDKFQRRQRTQS